MSLDIDDIGWREIVFVPTLLAVFVLVAAAPTPGVVLLGGGLLLIVAVILYPLGLGIHDWIRGLLGGGGGGGGR